MNSRRLMCAPVRRGSHPTTSSWKIPRCASQQIWRPMSQLGQNPKLPYCNSNGGFHLKERTLGSLDIGSGPMIWHRWRKCLSASTSTSTRRTGRSCSNMPASSNSKESCQNGASHLIARGARRTGSRARTQTRLGRSERPRKAGRSRRGGSGGPRLLQGTVEPPPAFSASTHHSSARVTSIVCVENFSAAHRLPCTRTVYAAFAWG